MASIIVDGLSSQMSYDATWYIVPAPHFYGGSTLLPDFAWHNSSSGGSVNFPFQGTSVAFFGSTPPANNSQWSLFSIDGSPAYNSSFMDPSPSSSRQWYQSPTLPDGLHNIAITHIPNTSVDYMVITAGQDTPLLGQVLIVDDDDSSITYGGNWIRDTSTFTYSDNPPVQVGLPFGNATHLTTSQGASAVFSFTGTGVTVAGIFSFDMLGTLSVNYTLDGFSFVQDYTVTRTSHDYVLGVKQRDNFVLFSNGSLAAGNHALEIQIMFCVNQVFRLDYILYDPSFSTLATKPSLSSIQSSTTSLSTSPTVDPSAPSNSSTSESNSSSSESHSSTSESTPVGAIVGSVVGGIVGVLLLILLLYRKRLFSRRTPSPSLHTNGTPGPPSLEPFTLASSVTGGTTILHVSDRAAAGTSKSPALGPGHSLSRTPLLSAKWPLSGTLQQSMVSSAESDERHVHRMNRLQNLSEELHRESAAAGGESNNPRVEEVRGRIAELMREESETSSVGRSTVIPTREIGNIPPPAYDSV